MKQNVVALIKQTLDKSLPFLLLRGLDANARAEGDIDILVPQGHAVPACQLLAEAARQDGWYVLSFRNIGYLASIVLVCPGNDGPDSSIKIDYFSGLEWYGVGSGSLSSRFFEEVFPKCKCLLEQYSRLV